MDRGQTVWTVSIREVSMPCVRQLLFPSGLMNVTVTVDASCDLPPRSARTTKAQAHHNSNVTCRNIVIRASDSCIGCRQAAQTSPKTSDTPKLTPSESYNSILCPRRNNRINISSNHLGHDRMPTHSHVR